MSELFIGLMSGTSLDGIDAALVNFSNEKPHLVAHYYHEFSPPLRQKILALCAPGYDEINRLGDLDVELGHLFAETVTQLLKTQQLKPEHIKAIGSHGQTIRHHPERQFTLQIGDPNIIAAKTGITTISDFRRNDIAHGGQGAPLVPAFHQSIFSAPHNRCIVNIGGIANITLLPANPRKTSGFDTGPGNTLLNAWTEKHLQKPYDDQGKWAQQGQVNQHLLEQLLNDPFFALPAPKSTGREYFNMAWLEKHALAHLKPEDVQRTLVALTAHSIIHSIKTTLPDSEMIICGGGVHNHILMQQLSELADPQVVRASNELGIDPDWVEAIAFAWLAKQTLAKKTGNLPAVTGAHRASILGGVYFYLGLGDSDLADDCSKVPTSFT